MDGDGAGDVVGNYGFREATDRYGSHAEVLTVPSRKRVITLRYIVDAGRTKRLKKKAA